MPKSISINTEGRLLEFTPAIADISGLQTALDGKAGSSHIHGNITNAGAIGSTSGLPIITTTLGVLTAGAFGTIAGSFCQGNDSRLSDARTPVAHNQAWSTITSTPTTRSGYGITDAAGLGANTYTGAQVIGTDPGGSEMLRVGGPIRTNSSVRANLMELAGTNAALDIYISSGNTGAPALYLRTDSRYDGVVNTANGLEFWHNYTGTLTKMVLSAQQLEVFGSVKSSGGFFKGVNEAVYANDSRLSDARTPVAHNQAWSTITSTPTTRSGYGITDAAGLGANTYTDTQTIQGTVLQTLRLNNTSSTGFINSINTNNAGGFYVKDEENNRIFFNYDRSGNQVSFAASSFRINGTSGEFSFRGKTVPTTDTFADWTGAPEYVSRGSDSVTLVQLGRAMTGLINTLRAIGILK
jgi:hypothetical protein